MLLKNKVAVIYGAGGVGGAVAKAFAREGARVYFAARNAAAAASLADDIVAAGGKAEAAEVDALDERAIGDHLQAVLGKAGGLDISFNAVGIRNTKLQGVPLMELSSEQF